MLRSRIFALWLVVFTICATLGATVTTIPAPERVDIVHSGARNIVYITSGTRVLRYDLTIGGFRQAIEIGGILRAIDISPDENFLVVTDSQGVGNECWVHLVDLRDLSVRKIRFALPSQGGTWSAAFGADGKLLVSGAGLWWADPATGTSTNILTYLNSAMLSASGDRRIIGVAETGGSNGSFTAFDAVAGKPFEKQGTTGWYGFEIAANRDGTQFALPTYGSTFIYDERLTKIGAIGQYAAGQPIGAAYHPKKDGVFFPWATTGEVRAYNSSTLQEVRRFNVGGGFSHTGNAAFTGGRIKMSADGETVFVTVPGGVAYFRHGLDFPTNVRLVVQGSPEQVGTPAPHGYGTNFVALNGRLTNTVPATAESANAKYAVAGHELTGASAEGGSATNSVVFTAGTNVVLKWLWRPTHFLLNIRKAGEGMVNETNRWVTADEEISLRAIPMDGWKFLRWTGDVPSDVVTSNPLNIRMDRARRVVAAFAPDGNDSALLGEWPTFGRDMSHSGYFPGVLGTNQFTRRWSATVGAGLSLNQVAVADHRVYVTPRGYFNEASLIALSEYSGEVVWRRPFTTPHSVNPPTFANGYVYVQRGNHGTDSQLFKIKASNGEVVWKAPFGAQWERYFAPVVAPDGRVYINAGHYGGMYGFDDAGQQLFFHSALPQYDEWTPAFWNNRLFSFVAGDVREHHAMTGQELWKVSLGWSWHGWSMNRTLAVVDGAIYVANTSGLVCVDADSRSVKWQREGAFSGTPAVANGVVYAREGNTNIVALAAATGDVLQRYRVNLAFNINQPIVTDDVLIFGSESETLVFDLISGEVRQRIAQSGIPTLADGTLYLADAQGRVEAWGSAPVHRLVVKGVGGLEIGNPHPFPYGTNLVSSGTLVTNTVPAMVVSQGTRYLANGWELVGVDGAGPLNQVVFRATNDATLEFLWMANEHELIAQAAGRGVVSPASGWHLVNSTVNLSAMPDAGMKFLRWMGDVPAGKEESNPLQLTMDQPRRISAVFAPENAAALSHQWSAFGNDPQHSSYAPGLLGTNKLKWRWTAAIPYARQVAVYDHRVYVSHANTVTALSEYSGVQFWSRTLPPMPHAMTAPTVTESGVFVQRGNHSTDSYVVKLDHAAGGELWRAPFAVQWSYHFPPIVADGKVYIQSGSYGGMSGYNEATGEPLFFQSLPQEDYWTPAYASNRVYSLVRGILTEHDPNTGARLGGFEVAELGSAGTRTLVIGDEFAFATGNNKLVGIDLAAKRVAWTQGGTFFAHPAYANGVVYVIEGGTVGAFNARSGERLGEYWLADAGANSLATAAVQPIITDDSLIVSGNEKTWVFDLFTRELRQMLNVGGEISVGGQVLYVATQTGVQAWSAAASETLLVVNSSSARVGQLYPFAYGSNFVPKGERVTATVGSFSMDGAGSRYRLLGWTGQGDVPASGVTNSVTFQATQDSTLTWNWAVEHLVQTTVQGSGGVNVISNWYSHGETVELMAMPQPFNTFSGWTGSVTTNAPTLSLVATQSFFLQARFTAELVTNNTPKLWLHENNLPTTDAGALADTDNDGLPNWREHALGLKPREADTDADTYSDGDEVAAGSNPADRESVPQVTLSVRSNPFGLGDALPYGYGDFALPFGKEVTLSVVSDPPANDSIRFVFNGFTGSGSIPASGSARSVVASLRTNSLIEWQWATEFALSAERLLRFPVSQDGAAAVVLTETNRVAESLFGWTVAVSGNWAVVGAPFGQVTGAVSRTGTAHVFRQEPTGWKYHSLLRPTGLQSGACFGMAVAIHGERLAVAALRNGVVEVYPYAWSPTTARWVNEQSLLAPTATSGGAFGDASLAMDDTQLAVGAPLNSSGQANGLVILYSRSSARWAQRAILTGSASPARERFGHAVALSGTNLLVGAPAARAADDRQVGAVYWYDVSPNRSSLRSRVVPLDAQALAEFGASVALEGNFAIVGAPNDKTAGRAFLYTLDSRGGLTPAGTLWPPTSERHHRFGESVAVNESRVWVGAPFADGADIEDGAVFQYRRTSAVPELQRTLTNSLAPAVSLFGNSVAADGETLAIGAPFAEANGKPFGHATMLTVGKSLREPLPTTWWRSQTNASTPAVPPLVTVSNVVFNLTHWIVDGVPFYQNGAGTVAVTNIAMVGPRSVVAVYEPADRDNDGMPTAWELKHGLDPLIDDGGADMDGDGASNLHEYLAGTRPDLEYSTLKLYYELTGTELVIHFEAPGTRRIIVQSSSPNASGWATFHSLAPDPGMLQRAMHITITLTNSAGQFYRVQALEE